MKEAEMGAIAADENPEQGTQATVRRAQPPGGPQLTWEDTTDGQAVDRIAWQMVQGALTVRRWIWTAVVFVLALVVVLLMQPR
jgi:hypothetical protein